MLRAVRLYVGIIYNRSTYFVPSSLLKFHKVFSDFTCIRQNPVVYLSLRERKITNLNMQEKYFYLPKGRSDFFKKRAKELHGSLSEMAKAAKLPLTTVSLILNGYRAPTVRSLKRIAKALSRDGVTVDPMHLTRGSKKGARK